MRQNGRYFQKISPQIVFEAEEHKHFLLMETVPEEAVKNNIFGAFNVATLVEIYKADKFAMVKITNEAKKGNNFDECQDQWYLSQIVARIFC